MGINAPLSAADIVDAITPANKRAPTHAAAITRYVASLTKDSSETMRVGMASAVASTMVCWMRPLPEQCVLLEAMSRSEFVNRTVGVCADDALYRNKFDGDQYGTLTADTFIYLGVSQCLSVETCSPRFEGLARIVMNTAAMLIATMPATGDDRAAQHNIDTARRIVRSQLSLTQVALFGDAFMPPETDIDLPGNLAPGSAWA